MPVVSVVIPLFNKGPHIARAIQSVLNQTEQNFEILIVDGLSTDDGPIIVKSFQDRRILFFEQMGAGVSSARNEGIEYSQSDFIAFLDADDEWLPDHLETLLRLRKRYPDAGAYTTAYLVKYPNSRIKAANFHAVPEKPWEGLLPSYFKSAAFGASPISTTVVGIPKLILKEMGCFNTETWWGEDTDLWGRIAFKYPIAFSWRGLGIYHTEATNRLCNRSEPIDEHFFVKTAKNAIESGEVPLNMEEFLLEYIAKKQIQTACRNIHAGRPDLAKDVIKNCKTRYFRTEKFLTLLWIYLPNPFFQICRALKIRIKRVLPNGSDILERIFKLS